MHILNRSFWATIALTALVDAAPSKLEGEHCPFASLSLEFNF